FRNGKSRATFAQGRRFVRPAGKIEGLHLGRTLHPLFDSRRKGQVLCEPSTLKVSRSACHASAACEKASDSPHGCKRGDSRPSGELLRGRPARNPYVRSLSVKGDLPVYPAQASHVPEIIHRSPAGNARGTSHQLRQAVDN